MNAIFASRRVCHCLVFWLYDAVEVTRSRLLAGYVFVVVVVGNETRDRGGLLELVDDCVRVVHVGG